MKKIYYMGRDITGKFSRETFINKITRKAQAMWYWTKIVMGIGLSGAMVGGLIVGLSIGSITKYTKAEEVQVVVEKIVEVERKASVMERIADCESGARLPSGHAKKGSATHLDKNGKVLTNTNNDGSVDVGIYQINMKYWALKAMEMDLNLTKEADNIKFAYWLYDNHGTEPWVWSRSCWNK